MHTIELYHNDGWRTIFSGRLDRKVVLKKAAKLARRTNQTVRVWRDYHASMKLIWSSDD